jgi:hypothetical protein
MSLGNYLHGHLVDLEAQWLRSLGTLPMTDLAAQRAELQRQCEGQVGPSPASLLVRLFDREIARRQERRRA